MKRLYIDIDGVLLTKKHPKKAEGLQNFIDFVIENYQCYWLTTHCKGESQTALRYLKPYLDERLISQIEKFKPTNWDTLKTEALEIDSDFYWLDDAPLNIEIEYLRSKEKLDRLIIVDLTRINELERIKSQLPTTAIHNAGFCCKIEVQKF